MEGEYLVLIPIEEMKRDAAYPSGQPLPLHCTVMPWFRTSGGRLRRLDLMGEMLSLASGVTRGAIELFSMQAAFFGAKHDVPVHLLRRSGDLGLLHTRLLVYLATNECRLPELQWIGAGYQPHVTNRGTQALHKGESFFAKHITLLERDERRTKRVIGVFPFGAS